MGVIAPLRSAAAEGPDEARLDQWLLLDAHAYHLGTVLLHLPHHEMRYWLLCRLRPCHQKIIYNYVQFNEIVLFDTRSYAPRAVVRVVGPLS